MATSGTTAARRASVVRKTKNGEGYPFAGFIEPTERLRGIRKTLFETPYSICLERPSLFDEFWKSPEGRRAKREHPFLRRALALEYVYSHRKPRIYDGELIIGNMTSKRIASNYYHEGGSVNILEDLFRMRRRAIPLHLSAWEKLRLVRFGLKYMLTSVAGRAFILTGRFSDFIDFFLAKRYFITEEAGVAHQCVDYMTAVHDGLRSIDRRAEKYLAEGRNENGPLDEDRTAFYRSIRHTIAGIRRMASNLADEAERVAALPGTDPARARELLESAAACRHVPYEPARTFLEGLQACWLIHIALNLEDFEQGLSFGRLDQILYPLYRRDIESGRLDRERAVETLASFCLKTCETIPVYSERIDQFFSGNGVAQAITVGGTDAHGNDVSNELSGLILDAYAQVRTREPALHVRVHSSTPAWLMERAARVLQLGCGKPSIMGDDAIVRALTACGMSRAHARDYAVIGCVEMCSQGRTYNSSDAALFNLPVCLELALNEGRQFNSRRRIGARTRPISRMLSFDDVLEAFRAQVRKGVDDMVEVITRLESVYRVWRTTPVNSMLTAGCMDKGLDVTWGAAMYDYTSIQAAGLATAGDSLYAIKRLVFEERRMGLAGLVDILKSDYRGREDLRTELRCRMPRYGNGIAEADAMTQAAADAFTDALSAHRNSRGGAYIPGFYSMTCHIGFGRRTGALPDGRRSGERLSNGLAPVDGTECAGPTAVLRSAASLDSSRWGNCYALNLKFDKRTIGGDAGARALSGLLGSFVKNGGMQVQVNVLDADTLRAAKRDPRAHPGIVVRVAGYCAYFTDLQPAVQDEIIERTAHGIS